MFSGGGNVYLLARCGEGRESHSHLPTPIKYDNIFAVPAKVLVVADAMGSGKSALVHITCQEADKQGFLAAAIQSHFVPLITPRQPASLGQSSANRPASFGEKLAR